MSVKSLFKSLLKRSTKKAAALSVFSLSSFIIATPSFAASVDLGSWKRSGDVSQTVGQATLTNAATDGNDDFSSNPNNIVNVSGNAPIDPNLGIGPLETFLEIAPGTLGLDATEGSAIKSPIALDFQSGDIFSFDWEFVSNDPSNDRAFVTIANLAPFFLNGNSGRFSYSFKTSGSYSIGIGVFDGGNDVIGSSKLVASNANVEPVPEPLTILGSMTALGWGWRMRQRFRKKR
ncbi:PEP-CTERM sorting domain-containing protein [Scytonema sp. NUACC26]|uniref:PEP-CTERM sorting domain-containing protein n=1 Tax=Scytonema sp. NUACC26 TaxID=3140176 RepID=UPI0034DC3190